MASVRVERSARQSEAARLVSEVIAHLLRAASVRRDESRAGYADADAMSARDMSAREMSATPPWRARGGIDDDPSRDGRALWLLDETCNRQALLHRYEDMRRRDRGGKWDGTGYPFVQADERALEQLAGHHDPADDDRGALDAEESRLAWRGLVRMVERRFGPHDDVCALVRLLAEDADVQESFGSQWPIAKIVGALRARDPGAAWDDDRVDNAKRRLTRWIARMRSAHGLDAIDLGALLVRYARESERGPVHP